MMCGFTLLSLHSDSTGPFLFLWIIHGSPVEGRLNWDVVVLSRVLGGSRALGRKFNVVPNSRWLGHNGLSDYKYWDIINISSLFFLQNLCFLHELHTHTHTYIYENVSVNWNIIGCHPLNQCWFIISWTIEIKIQRNFRKKKLDVVCKMLTIL